MDVLDNELLRFWKNLNDAHVRYIMIGGFAIRFQGFNRNTDDLDIWIEDTLENRKNLRIALNAMNVGDFPMIETPCPLPVALKQTDICQSTLSLSTPIALL